MRWRNCKKFKKSHSNQIWGTEKIIKNYSICNLYSSSIACRSPMWIFTFKIANERWIYQCIHIQTTFDFKLGWMKRERCTNKIICRQIATAALHTVRKEMQNVQCFTWTDGNMWIGMDLIFSLSLSLCWLQQWLFMVVLFMARHFGIACSRMVNDFVCINLLTPRFYKYAARLCQSHDRLPTRKVMAILNMDPFLYARFSFRSY